MSVWIYKQMLTRKSSISAKIIFQNVCGVQVKLETYAESRQYRKGYFEGLSLNKIYVACIVFYFISQEFLELDS